jgi:internalin A
MKTLEHVATSLVAPEEPTIWSSLDWTEPDRSKFMNPWDSKPLLGYYRDLLSAYGYIRLIGLPQIKDNPDIPIESLFVEPEFLESPISADAPMDKWPSRSSVTDALINHPRLVVLGDPGAGKTSLQSWLVTQFCRSGSSRLQNELGSLVPIPIVLRELPLPTNLNWAKMLDLFLAQPTANKIRGQRGLLEELFSRGQVLVMLDGLDEVSNEAAKKSLKYAVVEGIAACNKCRWLMTSRIVGYERIPFHSVGLTNFELTTSHLQPAAATPWVVPAGVAALDLSEIDLTIPQLTDLHPAVRDIDMSDLQFGSFLGANFAKVLYLAPFDDRQIEALVRKWYAEREASSAVRDECIHELLGAIHENASTQRLARVPNLLTMMALIHRVRARLPQGRVNLYRDITEAYLQTIDDFRGLKETAYTLPQKKLWLARIAFEMQSRRKIEFSAPEDEQTEGILVESDEVLKWLAEVMEVPDPQDRMSAAGKFLDYLQRRTGLIIERSPGQWSFLHLSFQEYFAACFLAEEVTSPDWLSPDYIREGCRPSDIQQFTEREAWKETFVFLFELLGQERPRWSDRVATKVFENTFAKPREPKLGSVWSWQSDCDVLLLAELSVNAYCSFSTKLREDAWAIVWRCSFPTGRWILDNPAADALFAAAPQFSQGMWRVCSTVSDQCHKRPLNLCGCKRAEDISPLVQASSLERLYLSASTVRRGLADVAKLSKLQTLELNWPGNLDNPSELLRFINLEQLGIRVSSSRLDLRPLASLLSQLRGFFLYEFQELEGCEVLGACSHLSNAGFSSLSVNETYSFLRHLLHIRSLWLRSSSVIQRLHELPIRSVLDSLQLSTFYRLVDLNPPAPLQELKYLSIQNCDKLSDLSPLSKLTKLERLELYNCPQLVSLAPLANCPNLSRITVEGCGNLRDIPESLKSKLMEV